MQAPGIAAFALAAGAPAAVGLPADAVVLPGSAAAAMLHQCSRQTPQPGEATWHPGAEDIAALEAALHATLTARPPTRNADWSRVPQGWRRQYVGLVRGGRRYVYGNFFPALGDDGPGAGYWRREPAQICDGGPGFFGVEFDVEDRRITQLAFNGPI